MIVSESEPDVLTMEQLEEVYKEERQGLLDFFAQHGRNPADAEDAIQDVLVHLLERPELWQKRRSLDILRAVFWVAVKNKLVDIEKKTRVRLTYQVQQLENARRGRF